MKLVSLLAQLTMMSHTFVVVFLNTSMWVSGVTVFVWSIFFSPLLLLFLLRVSSKPSSFLPSHVPCSELKGRLVGHFQLASVTQPLQIAYP